MKVQLLATAAVAAALFAAPAFAQDVAAPSGYVGATYSHLDLNSPLGDSDADLFGAEAAVAGQFGASNIGFQLDGSLSDGDNVDTTGMGSAHVFYRNDQYLVGAFGGVAGSNGSTTWGAGVEGQTYFDRATLAGAVAWATNDDVNIDLWGANAEARFFAQDNLRFDVNGGFANVDFGPIDTNVWTIGAGGEYQFDRAPVSLFAKYNYVSFDDLDVNENIFAVGVRWNFGGATLKQRDRSGASLNGFGNFSNLVF
jgi:hypothetical protein